MIQVLSKSRHAAIPAVLLAGALTVAACGDVAIDGHSGVTLRLVTPDADNLPEAATDAMVAALQPHADDSRAWSLISLRWHDDWALATVTSADLDAPLADHEESHLGFDNLYALLAVRTGTGWRAALEGDEHVHELLALVPETALSPDARAAIFPHPDQVVDKAYSGYKLPWPAGAAWRTTQSWHDSTSWGGRFQSNHSLDFDILGASNSDILASAPGTIDYICNDGTQMLVVVKTSGTNELLGYLHLARNTVDTSVIYQGNTVNTGTRLGQMLPTDSGLVSTTCGYSDGTHLHMYFPYKPITLDGVTFSSTNVQSGVNLYSTQGGCSTASLSQPSDRWRLKIWNNRYFSGSPVDIRYDYPGAKGFAVNWGGGGPSTCAGNDNYAVRFTRTAYFASSGYYDFTTTADDGVRVYIDGSQIINGWYDQAPTTYSAQVWVNAGWRTVRVDYYENGGGATVSLDWQQSGSYNPYPSCPCNRPDNYCQHGPSTPGCPMTYPGGYCDPNGDGGYGDGDWTRGWYEYSDYCL